MKKVTALSLQMTKREEVNTKFSRRTVIHYAGKCGCGKEIFPKYFIETAEWTNCFEGLPKGRQKTVLNPDNEASRFEYLLACSQACLREMKGLIPKKSQGGKREIACRGCGDSFIINTINVRQRSFKYCSKCREKRAGSLSPETLLRRIEEEKEKNKKAEKRKIQGGSPGLGKKNGPSDRFK